MSARVLLRAVCAGALALACATGAARATVVRGPADVPNPLAARQSWVADEAHLLSPAGIAAVDARVFALEKACGAQIAVATVDSLDTMHTPRTFATALFAAWGVGQRGRDNGVLVLLTLEPRRIEVETGYGAEAVLPDGKVGRLLDEHAVPNLRAGDYDAAIGTLVDAMAEALERDARSPLPEPVRRVPLAARVLALVVAAMGGTIGFLRWKAFRRRCPQCGRLMRFVPGRFEGSFLSGDEQLEEQLHSVDHRVFRCEPCDANVIEHHRRLFSTYSNCPKCTRRTLGYKSHVLVAATTSHTGKREVTRRCAKPGCGYVAVTVETIARIEADSSSGGSGSSGGSSGGGSSFGGGSSGGGGSGRSW
ncbi:MAG: TPM domain-containing protein [Candidatus Eisenbacteria bacterium]